MLDTLINKLILSMLIAKRKNLCLFDIGVKINLFKIKKILIDSNGVDLYHFTEDAFESGLVPANYPYYQDILKLDSLSIDNLKEEIKSDKDIFYKIIVFSLICNYYYESWDSEKLELSHRYIPEVDLKYRIIFDFILLNFKYNVKSFYLNESVRKNLEEDMIKKVDKLIKLGYPISEQDLLNFKNYLKSEYVRLIRL